MFDVYWEECLYSGVGFSHGAAPSKTWEGRVDSEHFQFHTANCLIYSACFLYSICTNVQLGTALVVDKRQFDRLLLLYFIA